MPQEHPDTREQARQAKEDYDHWTNEIQRIIRELKALQFDLADAEARSGIAFRTRVRLGYGPDEEGGGRR